MKVMDLHLEWMFQLFFIFIRCLIGYVEKSYFSEQNYYRIMMVRIVEKKENAFTFIEQALYYRSSFDVSFEKLKFALFIL